MTEPRKECCKNCKSLKDFWWFEKGNKFYGSCCIGLLDEDVVMKINEPEKVMCEMFEEEKK